MKITIFSNAEDAGKFGAAITEAVIRRNAMVKLGLATGSSPVGIYKNLVKAAKENQLRFNQASAYNLDEYVGLSAEHPQSFAAFMREHLFNHIDMPPENVHIPKGDSPFPEQECARYEALLRAAGQLDIQLLGIGLNGHIGFNEPGDSLSTETHLVTLTEDTRRVNAKWFPSAEETPKFAITMGLGSIMKAKRVLFIAQGQSKSAIIEKAFTGPVTTQCPGSLLQLHPEVTVLLDEAAAFGLTGGGRPPFRVNGAKRLEFVYDPIWAE